MMTQSPAAAINPPSPAAQERIRHIVEASAAVFAREGYAGTSMKDIAREAGIAQGLIHYYFGSKEDLVLAVVQQACAEMMEATRRSFSEVDGPPLVRAWTSIEAARKRSAERPELFRLLIEMAPLAHGNPALRAQMEDMYVSLVDEVTDMVEELNAQLPTPLPVPTRDFAGVIIAAIDGMALRGQVDPETDQAALYRALGFLLLAGMTASYAVAGLPVPSIGEVSELLGIPAPSDDPAVNPARPGDQA